MAGQGAQVGGSVNGGVPAGGKLEVDRRLGAEWREQERKRKELIEDRKENSKLNAIRRYIRSILNGETGGHLVADKAGNIVLEKFIGGVPGKVLETVFGNSSGGGAFDEISQADQEAMKRIRDAQGDGPGVSGRGGRVLVVPMWNRDP